MFAVLDVETANHNKGSICSIGVVYVDKGEIIDSFHSLINPHAEFDNACVRVHHIKPEHVADAPSFADVWPGIYSRIKSIPIVAYNATFDIYALQKSVYDAGFAEPNLRYACAMVLSKQWVECAHYKLSDVAAHYGIDYDKHNALGDATAAAMIVLSIMREQKAETLHQLMMQSERDYSYTRYSNYNPQINSIHSYNSYTQSQPFAHGAAPAIAGKNYFIIGTLQYANRDTIKNVIAELGGTVKTKLSKKINVVVVANDVAFIPGLSQEKLQPVYALRDAGCDIEIIDENTLFDRIMEG